MMTRSKNKSGSSRQHQQQPPRRDSGGEEAKREHGPEHRPAPRLGRLLPGPDRFARPDFGDVSRWRQRVVSNLLHHQTSYLAGAAVLTAVVGFPSPLGTALGGTAAALACAGLARAARREGGLRRMKARHPAAFVAVVVLASCLLISVSGAALVFVLGITFPLLLTFVHASLRLRNLRNKLENKMEGLGLKRTPMGVVLDALERQKGNISKLTDCITKVKE